MDFTTKIAAALSLPDQKVKNTIELLSAGNTIPFIARYRKEITGNLDEVQIRDIQDEFHRLTAMEERRQTILKTIKEQGNLTDELKEKIRKAESLAYLEDLYLPYRPKRRTKAMVAREKGLAPLAELIVNQIITQSSLSDLVKPFITTDVPDQNAALSGAEDIVAEIINDHAEVRVTLRTLAWEFGQISVTKNPESDDPRKIYEIYYDFEQKIKHLLPHQVLALNRGEGENVLKVQVHVPEHNWRRTISDHFPVKLGSVFSSSLLRAVDDCAGRLLLPAIERDIRRSLTEMAEQHAIQVFAKNLHALLTQPPISGHIVLAIDPGFRTGSKVVVLDPTGKVLDTTTIYPHPPQNKREEAKHHLQALISEYGVTLIVIGNGTASRETESLIAEMTSQTEGLNYLITSEAGASVYSASKAARAEFPEMDVSMRGAVSIGRRVQDPLAELVKIDPKAIGVGLYQHDINQTHLSEALDQVVESVVNKVGVDVNTASAALLTHVSGIGPVLAEKILQYREANGPFTHRQALMSVPGLGAKTFQQSAGFLRIRGGEQPLDLTAIHPESYPVAEKILNRLDLSDDIRSQDRIESINRFTQSNDLRQVAQELNTGVPTIRDILDEIARPGRDPREDLPKPLLKKDILTMEDLKTDMVLVGTIRNVVDFGAFVDIGVKTDGLLHRSKIKKSSNLKVGDIIQVIILDVDHERGRISLGMKESSEV